MKSFIWNWEEINEWLPIYDAVYSHMLAPSNCSVLEIGTWKGGWVISMAENDRSRKVTCVDPYPNLEIVRDSFLNTANVRAQNQVRHFETLNEVLDLDFVSFDVIHLDGEHSQQAVEDDFKKTAPLLTPEGLYIIDDIFYHSFPGVTAAAFQHIDQFELAPFLFSEKKLYLCRKSKYQDYYLKAKSMLDSIGLEYEEDQLLTGESSSYLQRNSINGFSILIPKIYAKPPAQFLRILGIKRKVSIKSIVFFWTPPVLIVCLKKIAREWIPRLIKIGTN
jgi:hypothetical protein